MGVELRNIRKVPLPQEASPLRFSDPGFYQEATVSTAGVSDLCTNTTHTIPNEDQIV